MHKNSSTIDSFNRSYVLGANANSTTLPFSSYMQNNRQDAYGLLEGSDHRRGRQDNSPFLNVDDKEASCIISLSDNMAFSLRKRPQGQQPH